MPISKIEKDSINPLVLDQGPAFIATSTGQGGFINSTGVVLILNTKLYDTHNCLTLAPNKFQPNVAGFYQINFRGVAAGAGITRFFLSLYFNGNESSRGMDAAPLSGAEAHSTGSCMLYFNGSTDYVDLRGYIVCTSGTHSVQFSGFLARAA